MRTMPSVAPGRRHRERSALGGCGLDQSGRPPHGHAYPPGPTWGLGIMERRPGRLRAAKGRRHDDLPHEPVPALPDRLDFFVSVNPGDRIRSDMSSSSARCGHPMYTFRTLEAQVAVHALQGHRRTFFAGHTSTTGSTKTDVARVRGAELRGGRHGSAEHEVAPARGQVRHRRAEAVRVRARSGRLLRRARHRRARHG